MAVLRSVCGWFYGQFKGWFEAVVLAIFVSILFVTIGLKS